MVVEAWQSSWILCWKRFLLYIHIRIDGIKLIGLEWDGMGPDGMGWVGWVGWEGGREWNEMG